MKILFTFSKERRPFTVKKLENNTKKKIFIIILLVSFLSDSGNDLIFIFHSAVCEKIAKRNNNACQTALSSE